MGKIIMIGAMKDSVGESVIAFNFACSLQKCGKKCLLWILIRRPI